jgi:hypothetical protein
MAKRFWRAVFLQHFQAPSQHERDYDAAMLQVPEMRFEKIWRERLDRVAAQKCSHERDIIWNLQYFEETHI